PCHRLLAVQDGLATDLFQRAANRPSLRQRSISSPEYDGNVSGRKRQKPIRNLEDREITLCRIRSGILVEAPVSDVAHHSDDLGVGVQNVDVDAMANRIAIPEISTGELIVVHDHP